MKLSLSQLSIWTKPGINQFLQRTFLANLGKSIAFEYIGRGRPRGLFIENISNQGKGVLSAHCSLLNVDSKQYKIITSGCSTFVDNDSIQKLSSLQVVINSVTKDVRFIPDKRLLTQKRSLNNSYSESFL